MKYLIILLVAVISFTSVSCKKNPPSCYSEAVHTKHKDDVCPFACTNVTGCDDKTYCNECEANKVGIKLKE